MVAEQMGEHGSVEDFIFGVVFFISLSLLLTFSKVIRDGKISQLLTQKQGCQVPSKEYQLQQEEAQFGRFPLPLDCDHGGRSVVNTLMGVGNENA